MWIQTLLRYIQWLLPRGVYYFFQRSQAADTPVYNMAALKTEEISYENDFQHLDVLGKGSFGVVLKAKHKTDQKEYAVKRIQFQNNTEKEQIKIENEIQLLKILNPHKQIVSFNNVWCETVDYDSQSEKDRQQKIYALSQLGLTVRFCYIQMELCSRSLKTWLDDKTNRDRVESLNIFKQIIEGLSHIHKYNVIHRDVKPANILIAMPEEKSNLRVRIADFGISKYVNKTTVTTNGAGTLMYMAPEIQLGQCSPKSDIYSAGLVLIELQCNWSSEKERVQILNDAKSNEFPLTFNEKMKFVLKKLLSSEKGDRYSSDELLKILNKDPYLNHESKEVEELADNFSQFMSTCTSEKHSLERVDLNELNHKRVDHELSWNEETDWFSLPAAESTSTQWKVQFGRLANDGFGVRVQCYSLAKQYRAASVRVFAMVVGNSQVWVEFAAVLVSGQEWEWCLFSKKLTECSEIRPIKFNVNAQWIELDELSPTYDLCVDLPVDVKCRWQLNGWKTVNPTADEWWLWSEAFGLSGAIWRIAVVNKTNVDKRNLTIGVWLQHLPGAEDWSKMCWKCSLSVWNDTYGEQMQNMEPRSKYKQTVVSDVKKETR